MHSDLQRSVAVHQEIASRIAAAFKLAEDDPAVVDTASGESDIEQTLFAALREAALARSMAEGINDVLMAAKMRQARLNEKAERLRGIVAWALQEIGQKRIVAPDLTVSLVNRKPALVIDDETALPAEHVVEIRTTKPNKDSIKEALENGKSVPGARLSNGTIGIIVRDK